MDNKKDSLKTKTFCILPWIHLHALPDSSITPCCISPYDDIYGNAHNEPLPAIWNSEKFKELRKNMLADLPSSGCSRCYKIEEAGFESSREIFNRAFSHHFPIAINTSPDGSVEFKEEHFKYLDIRFSNLCNFKCRGCGPTLSSSWFEDHQGLYQFLSAEKKVKSIASDSPHFWLQLKSLITHAEMIYFGGGEPLIMKEHFETLKLLESLGKFDTALSYNTNLSQLHYGNYPLEDMWSKFKNVTLGVSIDDIGARAEYFRHGTKWAVIEKNMQTIIQKHPHVKCYVNCTVNIMNVFYLPEIYDHLIDKNFISPENFNINLLLDPIELRIQVLSEKLKIKTRLKLSSFLESLLQRGEVFQKAAKDISNIINVLFEEDLSQQLPLFKEKTLKLDALRKENFATTFPELVELMHES